MSITRGSVIIFVISAHFYLYIPSCGRYHIWFIYQIIIDLAIFLLLSQPFHLSALSITEV